MSSYRNANDPYGSFRRPHGHLRGKVLDELVGRKPNLDVPPPAGITEHLETGCIFRARTKECWVDGSAARAGQNQCGRWAIVHCITERDAKKDDTTRAV